MPPTSLSETARSFLHLVAAGRIREAYDRHVSADFRHHNPFCRGDRESLLRAMEENEAGHPNKQLEIEIMLEDGPMVMACSHVRQKPDDLGAAIVHIFRFEDGLIVELWDVGQAIPPESPNENGMF